MPIIGITLGVDNEKKNSLLGAYVSAIEGIGGAPLLIPYIEDENRLDEVLALCDGVLFTGGVDINPSCYGEQKRDTCGEISPYRDEIELKIFDKAIKRDMPILAICRGCQLVNVALGGTLYQDIPSEYDTHIRHVQIEDKRSYSHEVIINEGTPLFALLRETRIRANSFHHQAIKELAPSLSVMATADDGIIEAVYSTSASYLRAYQWHPERLCDENNKKIFEDFINKARR